MALEKSVQRMKDIATKETSISFTLKILSGSEYLHT